MSDLESQMAENEQPFTSPVSNDDRSLSVSDILEETAGLRSRNFEYFVHPSEIEKDTTEYKAAVEDFFKLVIRLRTKSTLKRKSDRAESPDLDSMKTELDVHYKAGEKVREYENAPWYYPTPDNNAWERDNLLGSFVEPAKHEATDEFMRVYKDICKAVAEFELSASTLRTNSSAMTLSKKLVMQSAADIFVVLRDFRPRNRPAIPTPAARRMAEWARMKKEERTSEDSRKAEEHQFERMTREWQREREEEEERNRIWGSEYKSEEIRDAERKEIASRLEDEMWEVPGLWRAVDNRYEEECSQEEKRRIGTNAKKQLHALGMIKAERESVPRNGLSGRELGYVCTDSWGGGWLKRAEAEYKWMENDHICHPDDWNCAEKWFNFTQSTWVHWRRPIMVLWWDDVRDWAKRWRWRNNIIEEFKDTSTNLLLELEKIDGSVSAREFNAAPTMNDDDRHDILVHYTDNMKTALLAGDKAQFLLNSKLVWDLLGGVLRSKGVKQGLEALIKKQDHFRNSFMDFATVAIFFSSITATTLQFSFQSGDSNILSTIVNLCWFASLVLSIASATNSLLGVLVHQSPEHLRPSQNLLFHLLQNWFKYVPPMLLTCAGVLFLVGFCAFSFLSTSSFSSQGRAVQLFTTSFTITNLVALSVIILLAFTKVIQRTVLPVFLPVYLVTMILIFYLLFLLISLTGFLVFYAAAVFDILCCCSLFNHGPLLQDRTLTGVSKVQKALRDMFQPGKHLERIGEVVDQFWGKMKTLFALTFGGAWRRLKKLIWKPTLSVHAPAPDDPGHQSYMMGSVRSDTPPIVETYIPQHRASHTSSEELSRNSIVVIRAMYHTSDPGHQSYVMGSVRSDTPPIAGISFPQDRASHTSSEELSHDSTVVIRPMYHTSDHVEAR